MSTPSPLSAATKVVGGLAQRGAALSDWALSRTVETWRFQNLGAQSWVEAAVLPGLDSIVAMNRQLGRSVTATVKGEQTLRDLGWELADRFQAGTRFHHLVDTIGRECFGSATWVAEEVLAQAGPFKLTWIPPTGPVEEGGGDAAFRLFHLCGAIPYGPGIMRMTQEYNLFDRFLERGIGVYAMELRGDRYEHDYRDLTIASLIEHISTLLDVAFLHGGRERLVMEGYCGYGTQGLAWLAARPEEVAEKVRAYVTFVSPVDGRRCERIARSVQAAPEGMMDLQLACWQRLGGFVPGQPQRMGLDLALGAAWQKTPLGYFAAGWMNHELGMARAKEELTPQQRRELAGAYWISPEAARRWPVPVDIARYTTLLFKEGLGADGLLPWKHEGQELSLGRVREETDLKLIAFYGGMDVVVPDATGHPMIEVFGDRYTHVVHPPAGHISYVLSPRSWQPGLRRSLVPNPIDLLLEELA